MDAANAARRAAASRGLVLGSVDGAPGRWTPFGTAVHAVLLGRGGGGIRRC